MFQHLHFKIFLLFVLFGGFQAAQASGPHVGIFQVVKGQVEVLRQGKVQAASVGMQVFALDKISTKSDSRARIQMMDRNILNVSPNSSITLEKYVSGGSAEIKVDSGKLRSSVEKNSYDGKTRSFSVKTPTAVAGVRGTDFLTSYNPRTQQSQVVTFSGAVSVAAMDPTGRGAGGPAVMVGPSQQTTVAPGTPPSTPAPVDTGSLNQIEQESGDSETSANGPPKRSESQEQSSQNASQDNSTSEPSSTNQSSHSENSNLTSTSRSTPNESSSVNSSTIAPRSPSSAGAGLTTGPNRMVQSTDLSPNLGGSASVPTLPNVSMPATLPNTINATTGAVSTVPTISPELNQIINDTTTSGRSNVLINLVPPGTN